MFEKQLLINDLIQKTISTNFISMKFTENCTNIHIMQFVN